MVNCPICGKLTCIHWPEHWVYRRGDAYYCSAICMDVAIVKDMNAINEAVKRRKEYAMTKVTLEQKKKAVEIAISGGNPLDYLKKCGSARPDGLWYTIKENLKKIDPVTYAKLPDYRGKTRTTKEPDQKAKKPTVTLIEEFGASGFTEEDVQAIKDAVPTVQVDGPIRIETNEPEKIEVVPTEPKKQVPLQYDGYTVRCIEGQYGKFYWDYEYNRLDWTSPEGEEVSMSPQGWKTFCTEIMPKVMAILGVMA